jgi:TolA-binding protein
MPDGSPPTSVSGELLQRQLQQARLDFDRGKYALAETGFRDLLTNFPGSSQAAVCKHYLARALFQQEKYEEARDFFAEVSAGRSEYALQARLYEAQAYFHMGLFAKAVELLDNLILGQPDTQEAELARRFLESNGLD